MIRVENSLKSIKKSNFVYLVEEKNDIKKLDFLSLDSKITKKINEIVKENKSLLETFYLGNNSFEKLIILFYSKNDKKNIIYFLGEHFPKMPNNLTICSNNDKNLLDIINTSILSRYKYNQFITQKEEEDNIIIYLENKKDNTLIKDRLDTINNIIEARNLGEMPPNYLTCEKFSDIVKNTKFKNIKVKILNPDDIQKEGLNLLWAVGKGSINKPYMLILEKIIDKNLPTYGIIGKGIVFDTGGIQVKPDDFMYSMKGDMCGAANTFAIMKQLDEKKLNVNVVACLCIAENHISGESFKPSDIYTSYSGKTVDIGHTDAEGRLILADGISYISKNYKTNNIITIATLTGAVIYGLGYRHAGIMGTDKKIINSLVKQSKENFEKYVELPFDNYFIEKTKSEVADLTNINRGVKAGSTMGAAFLYNFLMNNEEYSHIDIAGTAMNDFESYGYASKGATGFGVDSISKLFINL